MIHLIHQLIFKLTSNHSTSTNEKSSMCSDCTATKLCCHNTTVTYNLRGNVSGTKQNVLVLPLCVLGLKKTKVCFPFVTNNLATREAPYRDDHV